MLIRLYTMDQALVAYPLGVVRRAASEACRMQSAESNSDESLLRRASLGSTAAFDLLYRRHAQIIMTVAFRMLGDRDSAADITQTTFLRLWQNAPSLAERIGSLRAWLLTVARNSSLDQLRTRKRQATSNIDDAPESIDPNEPASEVIAGFRSRAVRDVLSTLNDEQRTVIELAFFGGLTQSEIASVTGSPLGTVKSRIRLAMQHLRDALTHEEWIIHE